MSLLTIGLSCSDRKWNRIYRPLKIKIITWRRSCSSQNHPIRSVYLCNLLSFLHKFPFLNFSLQNCHIIFAASQTVKKLISALSVRVSFYSSPCFLIVHSSLKWKAQDDQEVLEVLKFRYVFVDWCEHFYQCCLFTITSRHTSTVFKLRLQFWVYSILQNLSEQFECLKMKEETTRSSFQSLQEDNTSLTSTVEVGEWFCSAYI